MMALMHTACLRHQVRQYELDSSDRQQAVDTAIFFFSFRREKDGGGEGGSDSRRRNEFPIARPEI